MSRRRLNDEERAAWEGVARSVAPLRRAPRREPESAELAAKAKSEKPSPAKPRTVSPPPSAMPHKPGPPPLAPLGRRLKKQVARGTQSIDARLDLHGMTQAQAHHALLGLLRSAQARGARIVLVITGKGGAAERSDERGVLRRQVPLWLRLPEFRHFIVGFEPAGIGHGGEGALYVRLRRARGD